MRVSLANSSIKYNSSVLNDEEIDDTLVVWGATTLHKTLWVDGATSLEAL